MKNQAAVGNGPLVGMIFLQVTGLQAGTSLQVISNLVGSTMKNQAAVGNGLPVGMIFLQVIFHLEIVMEVGNLDLDLHPAGIVWEVGNLDLDHQLADKKENDFAMEPGFETMTVLFV